MRFLEQKATEPREARARRDRGRLRDGERLAVGPPPALVRHLRAGGTPASALACG
jgi:hypothetical protein